MSSSPIRLICPNLPCRKVLSVPESARGKTVRCRNCGMRVNVPLVQKKPPPPPTLPEQPMSDEAA